MTTMTTPEQFTLQSQNLGCLPIVNFFLNRIGHRPVYALGEWAAAFDPGVLGLAVGDAEALNDDRVGRTLDRLFDADRASLITATVLAVIREFGVETAQLHNDSTTVTVTGVYPDADGRERGGKPTPAIRHGHNKDFRPDLKQLLFILTISADGAVPIAYRVADGNTPDDVTHIPTWDQLRALVGSAGFLYVADSKLCSKQAMGHIASHGGRFVTIVPHGRREDTWFRDWAQTHAPTWQEARRATGARLADPDRVWRTFEAPAPSVDGYRVVWVHASTKAACDAAARAGRIEAGLAAIDAVAVRLASPKTRIKTRVAVEQVAATALTAAGAGRWVGFTITAASDVSFHQERRGRPGSATRYRRTQKAVFTITATIAAEKVAYDAVIEREIRTSMSTEGLAGIPLYPELRNCPAPSAPRILEIFNDVKRHHLGSGDQIVQTFQPQLTPLQQQVLALLHIPASIYS